MDTEKWKPLPTHRWFQHYQSVFNTVEINSTFYSMPKGANVRQWLRGIRDDFVFVVKANRVISHQKQYGRWQPFYDG